MAAMKALELKIPPLVLVALFALAMWLLAQLVPPLALSEVWRLIFAIGFATAGVGSREAGLEVMKAKLVEWGIPLDALTFVDGSGLDRGNRLSCSSLSAWLHWSADIRRGSSTPAEISA